MSTDLRHPPRRTVQRRFVVVPRDPSEKPDVPLRLPTHYCTDCGQRYVPCYACETPAGRGVVVNGPQLFPLQGIRNGLHLATCPDHGPISIACPHRSLTGPSSKALPTRRGDDPNARSWAELREHERQTKERIAIGIACALAGILIGLALGLLALVPFAVEYFTHG